MGMLSPLLAPKAPPISPFQRDGLRPEWMHQDVDALSFNGDHELEVIGVAPYQCNLWALVSHTDCYVREPVHGFLVAEEGNPHEPTAVAVFIGGRKVGYLSRSEAARLRPGLIRLVEHHQKPVALPGVIVGGGRRRDGRIGTLGVWLDYNPEDFAI